MPRSGLRACCKAHPRVWFGFLPLAFRLPVPFSFLFVRTALFLMKKPPPPSAHQTPRFPPNATAARGLIDQAGSCGNRRKTPNVDPNASFMMQLLLTSPAPLTTPAPISAATPTPIRLRPQKQRLRLRPRPRLRLRLRSLHRSRSQIRERRRVHSGASRCTRLGFDARTLLQYSLGIVTHVDGRGPLQP